MEQKKIEITRLDLVEIWQNAHSEFTSNPIPGDLETTDLQMYLFLKGLDSFLQKHDLNIFNFSKIDEK